MTRPLHDRLGEAVRASVDDAYRREMATARELERKMRRLRALCPGWRMELHYDFLRGHPVVFVEAPK